MVENMKVNDTTNVKVNNTTYDKIMKLRGHVCELTGKRETQKSILDLLLRFQEYANEDFDNYNLNPKYYDTESYAKLASYLEGVCRNPWSSECENVDIKVYIRHEGKQKPICESCWREIVNNGFDGDYESSYNI